MPDEYDPPSGQRVRWRRRVAETAARAYARAPAWVQTALCTLEGIRVEIDRYPARFDRELHAALARMTEPRPDLERARLARLRAMLVHAEQHVPYWRDLFARLRFDPRALESVDDLRALPVLTKDTILEQGPRMRAETIDPGHEAGVALEVRTSGSTGAGLHLTMSKIAEIRQWATYWRFLAWHGVPRHTWCAQLTGRVVVPIEHQQGPYWRVNYVGRQLLLSGYHLSPRTAPAYVREIQRRRVPWVRGYPSLVVMLADAALAHGIELPDLHWVTLASESVSPGQRARIEAGLGIAPREHYAQSEAVANASECPDGVLRIDDDFSVVELVADDAIAGARRIYGTSLDNWHQPFIRYDTGDLARPGDDDGQAPGRALLEVDGRREDYVELSSGAKVGRTDHIFKDLSFVREAQIRQREAGRVRILVVPRDAWTSEHESRLRRETARWLGEEMRVDIVPTDAIERGANGKLRLVVRDSGQ